MSDSVPPHRWQPTRLPHPWDSPSKNTGVGCHFLLQCMRVKSESEVAQSCLTLSDPMDCSQPGSSVHGIFPGKRTGVGSHCLLHDFHVTENVELESCLHLEQLVICKHLLRLLYYLLYGCFVVSLFLFLLFLPAFVNW